MTLPSQPLTIASLLHASPPRLSSNAVIEAIAEGFSSADDDELAKHENAQLELNASPTHYSAVPLPIRPPVLALPNAVNILPTSPETVASLDSAAYLSSTPAKQQKLKQKPIIPDIQLSQAPQYASRYTFDVDIGGSSGNELDQQSSSLILQNTVPGSTNPSSPSCVSAAVDSPTLLSLNKRKRERECHRASVISFAGIVRAQHDGHLPREFELRKYDKTVLSDEEDDDGDGNDKDEGNTGKDDEEDRQDKEMDNLPVDIDMVRDLPVTASTDFLSQLEAKYIAIEQAEFAAVSSDKGKQHKDNLKARKKALRRREEWYDTDDSFIDDADEFANNVGLMQPARSGFFVHLGELQVVPMKGVIQEGRKRQRGDEDASGKPTPSPMTSASFTHEEYDPKSLDDDDFEHPLSSPTRSCHKRTSNKHRISKRVRDTDLEHESKPESEDDRLRRLELKRRLLKPGAAPMLPIIVRELEAFKNLVTQFDWTHKQKFPPQLRQPFQDLVQMHLDAINTVNGTSSLPSLIDRPEAPEIANTLEDEAVKSTKDITIAEGHTIESNQTDTKSTSPEQAISNTGNGKSLGDIPIYISLYWEIYERAIAECSKKLRRKEIKQSKLLLAQQATKISTSVTIIQSTIVSQETEQVTPHTDISPPVATVSDNRSVPQQPEVVAARDCNSLEGDQAVTQLVTLVDTTKTLIPASLATPELPEGTLSLLQLSVPSTTSKRTQATIAGTGFTLSEQQRLVDLYKKFQEAITVHVRNLMEAMPVAASTAILASSQPAQSNSPSRNTSPVLQPEHPILSNEVAGTFNRENAENIEEQLDIAVASEPQLPPAKKRKTSIRRWFRWTNELKEYFINIVYKETMLVHLPQWKVSILKGTRLELSSELLIRKRVYKKCQLLFPGDAIRKNEFTQILSDWRNKYRLRELETIDLMPDIDLKFLKSAMSRNSVNSRLPRPARKDTNDNGSQQQSETGHSHQITMNGIAESDTRQHPHKRRVSLGVIKLEGGLGIGASEPQSLLRRRKRENSHNTNNINKDISSTLLPPPLPITLSRLLLAPGTRVVVTMTSGTEELDVDENEYMPTRDAFFYDPITNRQQRPQRPTTTIRLRDLLEDDLSYISSKDETIKDNVRRDEQQYIRNNSIIPPTTYSPCIPSTQNPNRRSWSPSDMPSSSPSRSPLPQEPIDLPWTSQMHHSMPAPSPPNSWRTPAKSTDAITIPLSPPPQLPPLFNRTKDNTISHPSWPHPHESVECDITFPTPYTSSVMSVASLILPRTDSSQQDKDRWSADDTEDANTSGLSDVE